MTHELHAKESECRGLATTDIGPLGFETAEPLVIEPRVSVPLREGRGGVGEAR